MFVLPSRSENFANTVLEAMAAGCAVIVTPAVGLAQAVRESGCGIVCDDTAVALAAAMQRLAADPRRADDMGACGRQLVRQNYLWPTVAARMSHVYADLMRERH
jgi:glycosyltransferase involved in cell wall biosynthesis